MRRIAKYSPGLDRLFVPSDGQSVIPDSIERFVQWTFPFLDATHLFNQTHLDSGGVQVRSVAGVAGSTTVNIAGSSGPPLGFYEQNFAVCLFHDDIAARDLFLKLAGTDTATGAAIEILLARQLATAAGINNALIFQPAHKIPLTTPGGLFLRGEASAMGAGNILTIVRFGIVGLTGQPSL